MIKINLSFVKRSGRILAAYGREAMGFIEKKTKFLVYGLRFAQGLFVVIGRKLFALGPKSKYFYFSGLAVFLISIGVSATYLYPGSQRSKATDHLQAARDAAATSDYTNAVKEYKIVLSGKPDNKTEVLRELAFVYQLSGQRDEALPAYEEVARDSKADATTYNILGNLYRDKSDYAKAEEAYKKALEQNPNLTLAVVNLGHLYNLEQKNNQAIELYAKYYDGSKAKSAIGLQLAAAYRSEGNTDQAKKILAQILEKNPDDQQAQKILAGMK